MSVVDIGTDRTTVIAGIGLVVAGALIFLSQTDASQFAGDDRPTVSHRYDTNDSEQRIGQRVAQQGMVVERRLPGDIERGGTYTVSVFLVADQAYDAVTVTEEVPSVLVPDRDLPLTFSLAVPRPDTVYNVSYTITIPTNTSNMPAPTFDGTVSADDRTFPIEGDTRFG